MRFGFTIWTQYNPFNSFYNILTYFFIHFYTSQPIEIGIIYDVFEDQEKLQPLIDLTVLTCKVISEFGDSLKMNRFPGATVQV